MAGALAAGNRGILKLAQKAMLPFPGNDFVTNKEILICDNEGQTYFEWSITGSAAIIDRSNAFSKHGQFTTSMPDGSVTLNGYVPLEYLMGIQVGNYYEMTIKMNFQATPDPALPPPSEPKFTNVYRYVPFIVNELVIGSSIRSMWSVAISGKIQYAPPSTAFAKDPFDDAQYIKKDPVGLGYIPRTGRLFHFPYNNDWKETHDSDYSPPYVKLA